MKRLTVVFLFMVCFVPLTLIAQGEVIYQIDGMDDVTVQNVEYRAIDDMSLTMDIYYPPGMDEHQPLPVVILVNGFRDSRVSGFAGGDLKDTATYTSWGRLIAASGLIAITHQSEQADDLEVLISFIRDNAESLHIDGESIGLMASSSNPPTAISYANQDDHEYIKVAVFYYGSMTTPDGEFTDAIDSECRQYGCYGPSEVAPLVKLRRNLPTLVVRAGFSNGENPAIDHFVAQAIDRNVPLTFINFPSGRHGFDNVNSSVGRTTALEIIAFTLDYLASNLMGQ